MLTLLWALSIGSFIGAFIWIQFDRIVGRQPNILPPGIYPLDGYEFFDEANFGQRY